ncbi:hypothetical protein BDA96_02G375800 [Sorghum bicolor]|uniref:Uncharacterized protein n=2 Tax=Sorghum bicolor TaxID=4558 RepID=A0A921UXP2_SORBI|nr:hypothetical protein BDA96_02G375800 [Sorghum bicolor]KXG36588.1 hypothetical protein SORBI_3002G358500 [Sorghum bicolor]
MAQLRAFDPTLGGGALLQCGHARRRQQRRLPGCCPSANYVGDEFLQDSHALLTREDDTWEDCVLIHKIRKLGSSTIKLRRRFSPTESPDYCTVFVLNIWMGILCRDLKP